MYYVSGIFQMYYISGILQMYYLRGINEEGKTTTLITHVHLENAIRAFPNDIT